MADRTDFDAAYEAGKQAQPMAVMLTPLDMEGRKMVAFRTPQGGVEIVDLSDKLARPQRIAARPTFTDAASFSAYVRKFSTLGTLLMAKRAENRVVALLDYHAAAENGAHEPSWSTHVAALALELSPEWQTWKAADTKQLSQVDFAEFLEQNLADIAEPDGATVLEAASALESNRTVSFKGAIDLRSGMKELKYQEADGGANGAIKLPVTFTLALPVYTGGEMISLMARLRYRINDGKLTFHYVLDRPHKAIERAFGAVVEAVQSATEQPVLAGTPG